MNDYSKKLDQPIIIVEKTNNDLYIKIRFLDLEKLVGVYQNG